MSAHAFIHTHIYTYTHPYIHTSIQARTHTRTHAPDGGVAGGGEERGGALVGHEDEGGDGPGVRHVGARGEEALLGRVEVPRPHRAVRARWSRGGEKDRQGLVHACIHIHMHTQREWVSMCGWVGGSVMDQKAEQGQAETSRLSPARNQKPTRHAPVKMCGATLPPASVISHATHRAHGDVHRFEKISNIIKQFKLGCVAVCVCIRVTPRAERE